MKKLLVNIAITSLVFSGINNASAATGSNQGVTFTWPELVFAPQSIIEQSTYAFDLNYTNNSGKDFYYVGYSLNTPEGVGLLGNFAFGVKNGASGTFRISLSYMNFLNFSGPANYSFNLCTLTSLSVTESCSKGTVVIKKKSATDSTPTSQPTNTSSFGSASINVKGVTVSWPEKIYIPESTNFPILVSFVNNAGKDVLKAEWILRDASGTTVASRSMIGLKNGSSVYETDNVTKESFKSGPGTYRVVVRVDGYDGTGTFQEEKTIEVQEWSKNNSQPYPSSLVTNQNSLNISGFTFTWPATITVPASGNVGVEIQFKNQTGVDILLAELMLVDYKGSRIFSRSVIGLDSGATSIQEDNTINESFPLGAGVYKIVATVKDYNGKSGGIGTSYIEVKAAPSVPKTISDLSASRSTSSIDYNFTKPNSYSPIKFYSIVVQALLNQGLDPALYQNYGKMFIIKQITSETFTLTSAEMKTFLTGKVVDISKTSFMVRVQSTSSFGTSYLSNGIYTNTSGFISNAPVVKSTSITCKKGASTKVVKGTSPKCPTGYKKVG